MNFCMVGIKNCVVGSSYLNLLKTRSNICIMSDVIHVIQEMVLTIQFYMNSKCNSIIFRL